MCPRISVCTTSMIVVKPIFSTIWRSEVYAYEFNMGVHAMLRDLSLPNLDVVLLISQIDGPGCYGHVMFMLCYVMLCTRLCYGVNGAPLSTTLTTEVVDSGASSLTPRPAP